MGISILICLWIRIGRCIWVCRYISAGSYFVTDTCIEMGIDVDMNVDMYGIIHVDIVIAMDIDNRIYAKGSRHQVQNVFGH